MGLTDVYRYFFKNKIEYTFWDYFAGSWQKNYGMRIDHFLASNNVLKNIKSIKTAVLWKKRDSTFEPDYCAQKLNSNPWIVQPFEHYEEVRVEDLIKKHQGS